MPRHHSCAIFESGRIRYFPTVGLLAKYLKVDSDSARRWRRSLIKEKKVPVKYYEGILIDFQPEINPDKNDHTKTTR